MVWCELILHAGPLYVERERFDSFHECRGKVLNLSAENLYVYSMKFEISGQTDPCLLSMNVVVGLKTHTKRKVTLLREKITLKINCNEP